MKLPCLAKITNYDKKSILANRDVVKLWKSRDDAYAVICEMKKGKIVLILKYYKKSSKWGTNDYYVYYDGKFGYIEHKVREQKPFQYIK